MPFLNPTDEETENDVDEVHVFHPKTVIIINNEQKEIFVFVVFFFTASLSLAVVVTSFSSRDHHFLSRSITIWSFLIFHLSE